MKRRNTKSKRGDRDRPERRAHGGPASREEAPRGELSTTERTMIGVFAAGLAATSVWAYWPTWVRLTQAWDTQPDYSHGYLVIPLSLTFLWVRRHSLPKWSPTIAWGGLSLLALSIGLRWLSSACYVDAIDGWSVVPWLGGCVWLLAGFRVFRWALPSIVFLLFMVPLPWSLEHLLSHPLQQVATKASCWTLQALGIGVVAEGNALWLGDHRFEVAQACSGLRIFVGIIALAFAFLVLVRRPWWERAIVLLATVPVALLANMLRIVVTCALFEYVTGEAAQRFVHDFSGWVMIPLAASMFGLVLGYLKLIVPEVESVRVGAVAKRGADATVS